MLCRCSEHPQPVPTGCQENPPTLVVTIRKCLQTLPNVPWGQSHPQGQPFHVSSLETAMNLRDKGWRVSEWGTQAMSSTSSLQEVLADGSSNAFPGT